ncbi:M23 family metallopeptidase [Bartonella apis]|uniref:M23 family metallopeptidase n=1 Tax=Bartonella apis TaxID=1686310 RepID=UPI0018DBAB64|nr:M23 family metallopeptidase [Bartonella apis]MBI0177455.1 M23 family metallopeptidase [Bartonella apis]
MLEDRRFTTDPGEDPALVADGRRQPDRRQISIRWLAGTILTGVTSCTLMGVALFVALDGREQLATPPELMTQAELPTIEAEESEEKKVDRIAQVVPRKNFDDRRHFDLSIMQKQGEKEVIRTQPFELVRMALAEDRPSNLKYPPFNALTIFTDQTVKQGDKPENNLQIYGTKVETEITLHSVDFDVNTATFDNSDTLTSEQAEQNIRAAGFVLGDNITRVAALHYLDPAQLGHFGSIKFSDMPDVKIIQENVSISPRATQADSSAEYAEDIIPFRKAQTIINALNDANYEGDDADRLAEALARFNGSDTLRAGSVLRIGIETDSKDDDHLVRASIYHGMHHILSISLNDKNEFIRSDEPEMTPVLKTAFEGGVPLTHINASNLPTIYDAIYRSVLSYDMPLTTARQLIRVMANDVDLEDQVSPNDTLEVFYATPNKDEAESLEPEIRFVSATLGGVTRKYYRFRSNDGTIDYYDSQGRSSKQFLLRKPVPNAIFRSPFGPRRHPILGYVRMHTGVDWSAPRGSPIIAAGDGVVTKAGPVRGYGNQTEIRHANGYVTSYAHQNSFAPGIKAGAKVHQGQIIGYVGSSGLATGPHCHFEVSVNNTKVDPMRIRLPDAKSLHGKDLEAFKRDRNKLEALINGQDDQKLAATVNTDDKGRNPRSDI